MKIIIFIIILLLIEVSVYSQKEEYKRYYYENKQISSEGLLRDGKPDGYWKTYYPNGQIKSEGNRKLFLLDSTWVFYTEKGDTSQIINYKQNKKNGYLITYEWKYDSIKGKQGGIISKELYLDDVKQGESYYYKKGKIYRIIPYKDGKKNGMAREFDENGNITAILEYKNDFLIKREEINKKDEKGLKQGYWKTFYPDGKIEKEMFFVNDTITGLYKVYNRLGQLVEKKEYNMGIEILPDSTKKDSLLWKEEYDNSGRIKYLGAFRNNKPIGIHKEYDYLKNNILAKIYNDEGILEATGYLDSLNKKTGEWLYYSDGKISSKGLYVNDKKKGEWMYYYPDGKIKQKGSYKNNKPIGKWLMYNTNGNIVKEENYENGKLEGKYIEYNDSGKVVVVGQYENNEKTGLWKYYIGDVVEIGKYIENQKDSTWIIYYDNGKVYEIANYIQGYLNGKYYSYWPNGKLKVEGYYIMGKKEKNWYFFDENGRMYLNIKYRNDKDYKINGRKIRLPKGSYE